jgi:hypothetical protein
MKYKLLTYIISVFIFAGLLSGHALALPVSEFFSTVTGKDMVGMEVTVTFSNNESNTYYWEDLAGDYSGVSDSWGSLLFNDDENTYFEGNTWDLSINEDYFVSSLILTGGNTVFDLVYNTGAETDWGTPGSELGYWEGNPDATLDNVQTYGTSVFNNVSTFWEFSDPVYLVGSDAVGDVYNTLALTFLSPLTNQTLSWEVDTDLVKPVPEPSAILLFGAGLIGIGALARRKKYNQH